MNKRAFMKRALDPSNAFISTDAEAVKVNPQLWDRQLRDYEEQNLVITPLTEQFDFRMAGRDLTVTVDNAPSSASDLVETDDIAISSISTRQITFDPTERGQAYQLTRKEAVRAFFNVAENMTKKLGYALALKKDALGYSTMLSGAGNAIIANGVAAETALTATDVLNLTDINRAIRENEDDLYTTNKYLLISYKQKQDLMNNSNIQKANEFGSRDAIQKGLIGELSGLMVFASHSITVDGNGNYKAVVLAESGTGEQAVGYAIKRDPIIEREYHARGRYWDIVAHEEYDFQVMHPNAICTIATK